MDSEYDTALAPEVRRALPPTALVHYIQEDAVADPRVEVSLAQVSRTSVFPSFVAPKIGVPFDTAHCRPQLYEQLPRAPIASIDVPIDLGSKIPPSHHNLLKSSNPPPPPLLNAPPVNPLCLL